MESGRAGGNGEPWPSPAAESSRHPRDRHQPPRPKVNKKQGFNIAKQLGTWHGPVAYSHPFKAATFLRGSAVCTLGHEMRVSHRITLIDEQITVQPPSGKYPLFLKCFSEVHELLTI